MNLEEVYGEIEAFSKETHSDSDYCKETVFVRGREEQQFAPLEYLAGKFTELDGEKGLYREGLVCDSHGLYGGDSFAIWYQRQFGQKLKQAHARKIQILYRPDDKAIFDAIELVTQCYAVLRKQHILINNKNLPTQLGEWYAKSIFGLRQIQSASQRGFDFFFPDGPRTEVKVHWGDQHPPKGVKIRKSLLELSQSCILIYVANNLTIDEICLLDSDFVMRKFAGKGHTIFLKDSDVGQYFFSQSDKHLDKIINSSLLMKCSTPRFAMKLSESFQ